MHIFKGGIFEVFLKMYLPLALRVYNSLFIDSLCMMVVDEIKNHILGLTKSYILTLVLILPSSFGFAQNEGHGEYI